METLTDLSCEIHVVSVCGPVREENQDAGIAWRDEHGAVALIVSDGMGGHASGREAAEIVVRTCLETVRSRTSEPWASVFQGAIGAAQAAVLSAARNNSRGRASMGATAALALASLLGGTAASAATQNGTLNSFTPANTTIGNKATLTYSVGGQAQNAIGSSDTGNTTGPGSPTNFVVDNYVRHTLTAQDSAIITGLPGQLVTATFVVSNTGNGTRSVSRQPLRTCLATRL
jgi:hypothetical protein